MEEYKAFGVAIEAAKKTMKPGKDHVSVTFDNAALDKVNDQAGDIMKEWKDIEKTHWKEDYDQAMNKAFSNDEAWNLNDAIRDFKNTEET